MPVAKLTASGSPDVMKTEDRNDSIDTIIRQAIGKEPFLSFPRAGDSPVQWIQLLHALDQQELPGWPLLSPVKVQLQKCDKCSREFCSPINHRRHMRVHHRLKKLDKLSIEEAKEVVSFKNVMLEEVPGSSILNALASLTQKQGLSSLPQYYLRAGSALLDIVESRPSSFPISSQELFSILDDSSEKTFLCGTAVSMQRYVFDGEAGKIGLEPKNIVSCTSFLVEQKLVKAWLADKEAEALKCQKQLVEEEEAAQKRQAEILERKRQKKLRQKEQKGRELLEDDIEIKRNINSTGEAVLSAETSLDTCVFEAHNSDTFADHASSPHASACHFPDIYEGAERDSGYECDTDQNIERQTSHRHNRRRMMVARQQGLPKSQWAVSNCLHASPYSQLSKHGVIQRYGTNRDQRVTSITNGMKVWSRKPKPDIDGMVSKARLQKEPDKVKNHEVLIGSISVTLSNCSQSVGSLVASHGDDIVENPTKQCTVQEKPVKPDSSQSSNNPLTVKFWRPIDKHGTKDPFPLQNGRAGAEADTYEKQDQTLSGQSSLRVYSIDHSDIGFGNKFPDFGAKAYPRSLFSRHAAKVFLAQRWKEAISSNHVKLVVSPDSEPLECQEVQDRELTASEFSNADRYGTVANAENQLHATSEVTKSKTKMKPKKGIKIKYIPKQKAAT